MKLWFEKLWGWNGKKLTDILTNDLIFTFFQLCLPFTRTHKMQISICEEMAVAQKASNRISPQARMERLLGVPEGHHIAVLSMRFTRRPICRIGTEASHYRWWCHNATDSRTSQTWLYILPKYGLRWCLFVPSAMSGKLAPITIY